MDPEEDSFRGERMWFAFCTFASMLCVASLATAQTTDAFRDAPAPPPQPLLSVQLADFHFGINSPQTVQPASSEQYLAGESAARAHGLKILKEGIETNPLNYTRFAIISRRIGDKAPVPPSLKTRRISLDRSRTSGQL